MSEHLLDVKRLLCPMPVIKLQNLMNTLPTGALVHVICTDPGTHHDIPAWCRMRGHSILSIEEKEEEIHFMVRKEHVNSQRDKIC